ncbi:MAG TPA: hypothetical protein VGL98_14835 [Gammaproteobacteria bacterium]
MLKVVVALFAVALASTAGAAGWRDLKIDGSSEAAFHRSLEAFNAELSRERNQVFTAALMDIWLKGTADAKADQREYTVGDYHAQLDGLGYDEVVTFTDPTGETAKQRYDEAKRTKIANPAQPVVLATPNQKVRALDAHGELDRGEAMQTRQGGTVTPHSNEGTCCRQQ